MFNTDVKQAHGSTSTFGRRIRLHSRGHRVASCSAYPIFNRKIVTIADGSQVEVIDGGYCASNPTLYAITDAVMALKAELSRNCGSQGIGVGNYPEPPRYWHNWVISKFFLVRLLHKTLSINTHSLETLASLLFKDLAMVRINDTYSTPDMAADLMEHNPKKLDLLYQRGGESFAHHEAELKRLFA